MPTVTAISPSTPKNIGGVRLFSWTGTGFLAVTITSLRLSRSGDSDLVLSNPTRDSDVAAHGSGNLLGLMPGTWDAVLRYSGGSTRLVSAVVISQGGDMIQDITKPPDAITMMVNGL